MVRRAKDGRQRERNVEQRLDIVSLNLALRGVFGPGKNRYSENEHGVFQYE
jgi:hypothetical protein